MTYVTKAEISKNLAASPRTIDTWKAKHGLPYIRIGQVVRFEREACELWMKSQEQKRGERKDD